jgi:hypothetical protein
MAYSTKELEEAALKVIKKERLVLVDEIIAFMPCCYATYYNHEIEKLDSIKTAVRKNKVSIKHKLRTAWESDGSSAERIALYKILGSEDERNALNGSNKEQGSGKVQVEIIDKTIKKVSDE